MSEESDRRRHTRGQAPIHVDVVVGGAPVRVARLIDVSVGGVLVELGPHDEPPALATRGNARLHRGDVVVDRGARVIRIRWGGRDRGEPVAPAVALVFDDSDDEAAAKLDALLRF